MHKSISKDKTTRRAAKAWTDIVKLPAKHFPLHPQVSAALTLGQRARFSAVGSNAETHTDQRAEDKSLLSSQP